MYIARELLDEATGRNRGFAHAHQHSIEYDEHLLKVCMDAFLSLKMPKAVHVPQERREPVH